MIACVYEDRPAALVGVKLAVLGLTRHNPDLAVVVVTPHAGAGFADWLARVPQARLESFDGRGGLGWNAKPWSCCSCWPRVIVPSCGWTRTSS